VGSGGGYEVQRSDLMQGSSQQGAKEMKKRINMGVHRPLLRRYKGLEERKWRDAANGEDEV
jgi:hypothetical protein